MLTTRTLSTYSSTGLRGSFNTLAISSFTDIICMHQKIPRYEKDIYEAAIDENLICMIATNGKLFR